MKVLLADDDPIARTMVAAALTNWGFAVTAVEDGTAAWQQLQHREPPNLCILDWKMPGFSGTELISKLRAQTRESYIYCMLLTGKDTHEDLLEGMNAGADDYLVKPFDPLELRARLNVAQRILAQQYQIDQARKQEMTLAAHIQQTLLFDRPMHTMTWADVAVLTRPACRVAGDFYGFIEYGTSLFDVLLGDVMGKGVTAALLGAAVKSRMLTSLLRQMAAHTPCARPEPAEVIAAVHREMTGELIDLESMITFLYVRMDRQQGTCTFVDGGHMPIIHVVPSSAGVSFLKGENVPLGVLNDEVYSQTTVSFRPNDVFVLYSDGLIDSWNQAGDSFDVERLAELVLAHADQPAEIIAQAIDRALHDHCQSDQCTDDQTCVVIRLHQSAK